MSAAIDPTLLAAAQGMGAAPAGKVNPDHVTDLILQLPMAAAFAFLATISLLQVLLPGPLSRRISDVVRWASRNTIVATIMATFAVGMAAAVAATALQLKYLYLSSAPPGAVSSGQVPSRGMSATAGLSATAGEGQKLWTTLLLGLTDIVLCINIWGHAWDQGQAAAAKADSKAMRKQAASNLANLTATVDESPAGATMEGSMPHGGFKKVA